MADVGASQAPYAWLYYRQKSNVVVQTVAPDSVIAIIAAGGIIRIKQGIKNSNGDILRLDSMFASPISSSSTKKSGSSRLFEIFVSDFNHTIHIQTLRKPGELVSDLFTPQVLDVNFISSTRPESDISARDVVITNELLPVEMYAVIQSPDSLFVKSQVVKSLITVTPKKYEAIYTIVPQLYGNPV